MANTTWSTTDKSANITLTGSNLIATYTSIAIGSVRSADPVRSGKYYWEVTWNVVSGANQSLGISLGWTDLNASLSSSGAVGALTINSSGQAWGPNGNSLGSILSTPTAGTVWCFALDATAGLFWTRAGAAGNWNNSAVNNPATGVGGFSFPAGGAYDVYALFQAFSVTGIQVTANFGDSAFTGTAPSGFTAGFTSGAGVVTNTVATQVAVEHFLTTNPNAQVTQVAVEHWAVPNVPLQVTQIAVEEWARADPPTQVTQIAVEEWASVEATYARPTSPTVVVSGSRAGAGSAVIR